MYSLAYELGSTLHRSRIEQKFRVIDAAGASAPDEVHNFDSIAIAQFGFLPIAAPYNSLVYLNCDSLRRQRQRFDQFGKRKRTLRKFALFAVDLDAHDRIEVKRDE